MKILKIQLLDLIKLFKSMENNTNDGSYVWVDPNKTVKQTKDSNIIKKENTEETKDKIKKEEKK